MTDSSPPWPQLIHHFKQLSSTMDKARQLAKEGKPEGTTVVAAEQNAGRGRRGRHWFSAPKAGLWMTTILRPQFSSDQLAPLGLVAGASVLSALHELRAKQPKLKWPNDIMVENRKLAGILLEAHELASPHPIVLIGIGLNIIPESQLDLPDKIRDKYIGLGQLAKGEPATLYSKSLELIQKHLKIGYRQWAHEGLEPIVQFWLQHNWLDNHWVQAEYNAEIIQGQFHTINNLGELEVDSPQGTLTIRSGEVDRIRPIPSP